jgi:hypothetical protein
MLENPCIMLSNGYQEEILWVQKWLKHNETAKVRNIFSLDIETVILQYLYIQQDAAFLI